MIRFYVMMGLAFVLGFLGVNWIPIAFITFVLAFSIILGVTVEWTGSEVKETKAANLNAVKGQRVVPKAG